MRQQTNGRAGRPIASFIVAALLLLLLAAFFFDALLPGRVLAPTDWIYNTSFYASARPTGYDGPSNPLLFDQVFQFIPWRYQAWKAMRAGELPLWNPDSNCGTPLLATTQAAIFDPINLLLLPLPFEKGLAWGAMLRLWLAGFGAYLLGRRYRLGVVAAYVVSVSYMLCGFLVGWLGHPHSNPAVWLPWLVLANECVIVARNRAAAFRATALLALVVGAQFMGGHIETSVDMLLALGLYSLLRAFTWTPRGSGVGRLRQTAIRGALWPGLGVVLGTLLAAPQLLPFLEWIPLSLLVQDRLQWIGVWWHTEFVYQLASLPLLAFPDIYNNPTWGGSWAPPFVVDNYNERVLYVGVVTLVFALGALLGLGRAARRGNGASWVGVWSVVGLFAFGRTFQLPVIDWVNRLPVIGLAYPARNRLLVAFALCLLAGAGLDLLLKEIADERKVVRRRWIWLTTSLIVLGLLAVTLTPLGHVKLYFPLIFLLVLCGLLLAAMRQGLVGVRAFSVAAATLVTLDLLTFGRGFNPTTREELFYPPNPVIEPAKRDDSLHRTTAIGWSLVPDSQLLLGLSDLRGMDFPTRWYSDYLDLTGDRLPITRPYGTLLAGTRSPLTRLLNIKYVLTSAPEVAATYGDFDWGPPVGGMLLGRSRHVQPRSFMVYESVAAADDEEAARLLQADPGRVYREVVLSAGDGERVGPAAPDAAKGDGGASVPPRVSLSSYAAGKAAWDVETSRPGYLVTTDSFYPGWNAYVDGRRSTIRRANLAFRAVRVPAGRHRIEYRYEPASFRWGVGLAVAGWLVLATCVVVGLGARPSIPRRRLF